MGDRYHFLDVSFGYRDGYEVISRTDIVIESGSIAIIEGDNGSGKTTLMRVLGGELRTKNESVLKFNRRYDRKLWYFPSDNLFPDITVLDYLYLCNYDLKYRVGKRYFDFRQKVRRLIEGYEIDAGINTKLRELSTGNKIYIKFLNLELNCYDALFLDEPTDHLDYKNVSKVLAMIKKYVSENNVFCLVSSHDSRLLTNSNFMDVDYHYKIVEKRLDRIWGGNGKR